MLQRDGDQDRRAGGTAFGPHCQSGDYNAGTLKEFGRVLSRNNDDGSSDLEMYIYQDVFERHPCNGRIACQALLYKRDDTGNYYNVYHTDIEPIGDFYWHFAFQSNALEMHCDCK